MSKVSLQGYIVVSDTDLDAVTSELPTHIELTRHETGCIEFNVIQDADNANRFNVYEVFEDKESFMAHQERVKQSKWGQVSKNVERHYEILELNTKNTKKL